MNRAELVNAMAEITGDTKKATEDAVKAFVDTISDALAKGDRIQLAGLGTFQVKTRAARKGKNPQTGAEIKIPACKAPTFKAAKALKDIVNK